MMFMMNMICMKTKRFTMIHNDVAHDGHDLSEPVQSVPELRRSSREKKMPDFYGIRVTVADGSADPVSLIEALGNSDKAYWKDAMEKEMKSLSVNKVWDLVSLPKDKKVVGSKWVFKTKRNVDGNVERYKARMDSHKSLDRIMMKLSLQLYSLNL